MHVACMTKRVVKNRLHMPLDSPRIDSNYITDFKTHDTTNHNLASGTLPANKAARLALVD